jgi:hypothetical protein
MRATTRFARWLADFLMCSLALIALVNAIFGVASFNFDLKLSLFGNPVTTVTLRFLWIALYLALSGLGFSYMLWRYDWRFGLATLWQIPVLWCLTFGVVLAMQLGQIIGLLAIGSLGLLLLWYAVIWASKPKPANSGGQKNVSDLV